jgi:hypothetical protein
MDKAIDKLTSTIAKKNYLAMAGNIIPAIATTNAIIAGMMVMLAFKILNKRLEDCKTVGDFFAQKNMYRATLVYEVLTIMTFFWSRTRATWCMVAIVHN